MRKVNCVCIKGWDVLILTRRPLYMEESVIHITFNLSMPRPVMRCAVLPIQHGLWAVLCCRNPLAAGHTQPGHCKGGPCRQLPLSTGDYTTCMALPVSKSAKISSHVDILYE